MREREREREGENGCRSAGARGRTHPFVRAHLTTSRGGWFLAERGSESKRETERRGGNREREQGNRDIDSTRDTAGCFRGLGSLASSTFDNFDNANYRMTN